MLPLNNKLQTLDISHNGVLDISVFYDNVGTDALMEHPAVCTSTSSTEDSTVPDKTNYSAVGGGLDSLEEVWISSCKLTTYADINPLTKLPSLSCVYLGMYRYVWFCVLCVY